MTEPATDDVDFHPRLEEMYGRGVSKEVRRHAPRVPAWSIKMLGVSSDHLVDPKARQRDTRSGAEHRAIRSVHLPADKYPQELHRLDP